MAGVGSRRTAEMRRPGEEQLLKHDSEQQQGQGTNAAWRPRRVGHLETLLLVGLEAMVDVASMLWAEVGTTVHSNDPCFAVRTVTMLFFLIL